MTAYFCAVTVYCGHGWNKQTKKPDDYQGERMRYKYKKIKESIMIWIAWHLPDELVKWCTVRVIANATQGKYSNRVVPELSALDALKRWNDK